MSSSVDVSSLDWDTILEYNRENAFAVSTDDLDDNSFSKYDTVSTDSYTESLGLLSNLSDELETIQTNLQYMLNYCIDGDEATSDDDKEEAYAQLRSMGAGIDSIVRSFTYEDDTLLSGRKYSLSYDGGTALSVALDNLYASDIGDDDSNSDIDGGLGLATADDGADIEISYDYLNTLRNASSDVIGFDISDAYSSDGDDTVQQLTDGDYQIEVEFNGDEGGENSTIYIESLDGTVIDQVDGLDLSGTGQMNVEFGCGMTLSLEKDGTAADSCSDTQSLYANFSYDTVKQFNLDDGTGNELITDNSVSVAVGSHLSGTTGDLKVSASTADVLDGRTTMTTGQYNLKIKYNADEMTGDLYLYDQDGTLISLVRDADLSGTDEDGNYSDTVSVDMGTGVAITLKTTDFTQSSDRTYNVYLDYTAEEEAYEEFDYDAYYDIVSDALDDVQDQIDLVTAVQETLEEQYDTVQSIYDMVNGTSSDYVTTLLAVLSDGTSGDGVDADSLFSAISGSSSSDSDSTLSVATADGDIFTTLNDTITTLADDDDYDVLALYYS
jgi:hypothetical protein